MKPIDVKIKIMENGEGLPIPTYATAQSAGMDLFSATDGELVIKPGERLLVPTGISIALPADYEAQIRPRSGLALKNGLTVLNTPGTIDADYRGEIKVIMINLSKEPFIIPRGMRIAQMIIAPVTRANLIAVATLDETARGEGGFGSTGTTG